jgi:hypothetical protein
MPAPDAASSRYRPCSAGWLPASQQCFSLTLIQHQPAVTSQPAVFFSHNKSAPATSYQPAERGHSLFWTRKCFSGLDFFLIHLFSVHPTDIQSSGKSMVISK